MDDAPLLSPRSTQLVNQVLGEPLQPTLIFLLPLPKPSGRTTMTPASSVPPVHLGHCWVHRCALALRLSRGDGAERGVDHTVVVRFTGDLAVSERSRRPGGRAMASAAWAGQAPGHLLCWLGCHGPGVNESVFWAEE